MLDFRGVKSTYQNSVVKTDDKIIRKANMEGLAEWLTDLRLVQQERVHILSGVTRQLGFLSPARGKKLTSCHPEGNPLTQSTPVLS